MVRLDNVLSNKGFGSRKEVKKLIKEKRVFVNDILVLSDSYKVSENDKIKIDNVEFIYNKYVYIMLNKPKGVISATQDDYHKTVIDLIDDNTKNLFPVGRLDIDTEGLCLITNDGGFAHEILSPKKHIYKTYIVKTKEKLSISDIKKIEDGIEIDNNEKCLPAIISEEHDYYLLSIKEGKYHQIKRMMKAVNNEVIYLKRIKMANLSLDPSLKLSEYKYLSEEELKLIK